MPSLPKLRPSKRAGRTRGGEGRGTVAKHMPTTSLIFTRIELWRIISVRSKAFRRTYGMGDDGQYLLMASVLTMAIICPDWDWAFSCSVGLPPPGKCDLLPTQWKYCWRVYKIQYYKIQRSFLEGFRYVYSLLTPKHADDVWNFVVSSGKPRLWWYSTRRRRLESCSAGLEAVYLRREYHVEDLVVSIITIPSRWCGPNHYCPRLIRRSHPTGSFGGRS